MDAQSELIPAGADRLPAKPPSIFDRLIPSEKRLVELTDQVFKKLMNDFEEHGTISLFHKKDTGKLDSAIGTVYLTSPKIPSLRVDLWLETNPPTLSSMEFHKHFFGVTQTKRFISAIERKPSKSLRAIAVIQKWDTPEGGFEINYRRDADKEGSNKPIPRSTREKIKFLEQILETTVDKAQTEKHFLGRPYSPGDSYSSDSPNDNSPTTHRKYWARDLKSIPNLLDTGPQNFLKE